MKFHDFSPFYRSSEGIKAKVSGDRLLDNPLVADVQSGASYKFDGSNDLITAADNANLDAGVGDFTWAVWFKTTSSTFSRILSKQGSESALIYAYLGSGGNAGQVGVIYYDGSGSVDTGYIGSGLNDGGWHYLTYSADRSGNALTYIDGVLVATTDISSESGDLSNSGAFTIGAHTSASQRFDGEIRQVRIHNRALTAAEVRASYNGQAVPFEYRINPSQSIKSATSSHELNQNLTVGASSDFSGAGDWLTNSSGAISVGSGVASVSGLADTDDFVYIQTNDFVNLIGKKIRVKADISSVTGTWSFEYWTGSAYSSIATGTGSLDLEWTIPANAVDGSDRSYFRWIKESSSATVSFTMDNFTVQPIGCVAEYLPESISSSSWLDSSGNKLNGVASGATATNADNNVPVQDGHLMASKSVADLQSGASFKFDGSDDYVEATTTSAVLLGASPFSISFWAKSASSPAHVDRIIEMGNSGGNFITICWATDNRVFYQAYNGSWDTALYTSNNSISNSEFKHFTLVKDGTGTTWYVNGVADTTQSTGSASDINDVAGKLRFGAALNGANTWPGDLRQVRLHNRALSADEVRAAYSGQAVSYEYEGASQTAVFDDNAADDDTSDWTEDGAGTLAFSTDHYTLANTSANNGARIQFPTATEVGKKYRISFDIKDGTASGVAVYADFRDYSSATAWATINTLTTTASFVTHTMEGVAADTDGGMKLFPTSNLSGSNIQIKNIKAVQIGCVAEYLPSGISATKWIDTSGNGLHGSTSTATAVNHTIGSLTVESGATIKLQDGAGIDFSNYTDGSVAGSTTSQLLDDYEEGTWTPVLTSNTGSDGALSHAAQRGTYTKIGRMVTLQCYMSIDNKGSRTGVAMIGGLPYTVGIASPMNSFNMAVGPLWLGEVDLGSSTQIVVAARRGETTVSFSKSNDDGAITEVQISELEATAQIIFTLSYLVD